MTTRDADRIIKSNQPTTIRSIEYEETFTKTFVSRDRYNITSADGGLFDRADLMIQSSPPRNRTMTHPSVTKLLTQARGLPADGQVHRVGPSEIVHLPQTKMRVEQVRAQVECHGTLFRRRCVNGKWLNTEQISGSLTN